MYPINDFIAQYLNACRYQRNLDEKTVKAYRIDLSQFSSFISAGNLDLTRITLSAYIMDLNKNFKPHSAKRKIASVKAFLNYLEDEGLIETNPFRKIRISLREPTLLPKTIPLRTIKSLLTEQWYRYIHNLQFCSRPG